MARNVIHLYSITGSEAALTKQSITIICSNLGYLKSLLILSIEAGISKSPVMIDIKKRLKD